MSFLLRPARPDDLEAVLELARFLDSPNLPAREDFLIARLERSARSFAQAAPPGADREYQFALEDATGRVVGTSALISKHGTPEMPHLYLRVEQEERVSRSLGVRARHVVFQLGANPDGPTELGALVLRPEMRGQAGWPGKLLSWGRFAYVAGHRDRFEKELLAEMRAALDSEGRSAFWESFGRRFTGITYDEADRLSMEEKQFVLDLFPETRFYATLLDPDVAAQLGQVHEETRPAVRLLEQAGFRWIGEIDPFDAGPFYGAATAEVIPVRETRTLRVAGGAPAEDAPPLILSTKERGFRAVAARASETSEEIHIPEAARERLQLDSGDPVARTPLPQPSGQRARRG